MQTEPTLRDLATNVTPQELYDIERHLDTPLVMAKLAVPPVVEWGPAHNREDFKRIENDTPEGLTYNI